MPHTMDQDPLGGRSDPRPSGDSGGGDHHTAAEDLATFGYAQTFKREFSVWSSFGLAFAFISPILGLYAVFALGLQTAGPSFWLLYFPVIALQFMVALVFAELSSRMPLAVGIYQWSRRLWPKGFGFFAGWFYLFGMLTGIATTAYIGAGYLAAIVGRDDLSNLGRVALAMAILLFCTVVNTAGRRYLRILVIASLIAEFALSVVISTVLLIFFREQSLGVLLESFGTGGDGSGNYLLVAFLPAIAFLGWAFNGFESASSLAEEVKEPRRAVPKAMLAALGLVGAVIVYSALGILLAIPDMQAAVDGSVADPVVETITYHLGAGWETAAESAILLGFVAGTVAIQAALARLAWAMSRDRLMPASSFLVRVSARDALPVNAVVVSAGVASMFYVSTFSEGAFETLVSISVIGFFIGFFFPLVGALRLRLRGQWPPGQFSLGRWGLPVNILALAWVIFETINLAWPRSPQLLWYQNWSVLLMVAVVGAWGIASYLVIRKNAIEVEKLTAADTLGVSEPNQATTQ